MTNLEKYIEEHSSPLPEALDWVELQTHLRTNYPRMLAGRDVGRLLQWVVAMLRPARVLELGAFTGYSSICIASALPEGGHLDSVEINDEMEDLIREGYRRAGVEERITLIIGDSKDVVPSLEEGYDLAYIDANKREYPEYLSLVLPKVRKGGFIIADNVLWDGKVCDDRPGGDVQTRGIMEFNDMVVSDDGLSNFILPLRDGWNIIRRN